MGKHFLWDPIEDNIVKEIDDSGITIADYTTEPYLYGDLISQHRDGQPSFRLGCVRRTGNSARLEYCVYVHQLRRRYEHQPCRLADNGQCRCGL